MGSLYTPFVIWDNFSDQTEQLPDIGMTQVVPYLLERYGIKCYKYYKYIQNMTKQVPVTTAMNYYVASDGNKYSYQDKNEYSQLVNDYLQLEYYNVKNGKDEELFGVK